MVEIINNDLQSTATYYQSIQNHFSYRLRQIIVIELNNAENGLQWFISVPLWIYLELPTLVTGPQSRVHSPIQ